MLHDAGYELKDESYETLVYEANVTTTAMKIVMFGFAKTLYRLAVTFRPDGDGNTAVTMIGQATAERARRARSSRRRAERPPSRRSEIGEDLLLLRFELHRR